MYKRIINLKRKNIFKKNTHFTFFKKKFNMIQKIEQKCAKKEH